MNNEKFKSPVENEVIQTRTSESGEEKGLLQESSQEFMLKKMQTPWWISRESFYREGEGESAV